MKKLKYKIFRRWLNQFAKKVFEHKDNVEGLICNIEIVNTKYLLDKYYKEV